MAAPPDFDPGVLEEVVPQTQPPQLDTGGVTVIGADANMTRFRKGNDQTVFAIPTSKAPARVKAAAINAGFGDVFTKGGASGAVTRGIEGTPVELPSAAKAAQEQQALIDAGQAPEPQEFVDPGGGGQLSPAAAQLQALQDLPPGTVIGGTPGQLATVQGPTSTTTPVVSPEEAPAVQELESAIEQQAALREDQIAREAEALQSAADTQMLKADVRQQAVADEQARELDRTAQVAKRMAEFDEVKSQAINEKIDPGSFWARMDTGGKIATAFSVLIGGIAQGLTGRDNPGAEMLKRAMDRDMQAQLKNADNKFRNTGLSVKGVELVNSMFDRDSDRAMALQEMNLSALDQEIGARMAKAKAPGIVEALANARADVRTQIAELRKQLAVSLRGQQTSTTQVRRVGGTRGLTVEEAREQLRARTGTEAHDRERFVKELQGNAPTKEEGVKLRNEVRTIQNINGTIRELESLKGKGPTLSPTERNRADALVQSLSLDLSVYKNLGAISETDKGFVEGLSTGGDNPLTFANFQGGRIQELKGTLKRTIRNMQDFVAPVDFVPEAQRKSGPGGQTAGQAAQGAAREF